MTNKNEIDYDELEQVTGGRLEKNEKQYHDRYTRRLDKYDTENYIGQNLYFLYDYDRGNTNGQSCSTHTFIFGTLIDSYEKPETCGTTRTAKVSVIISEGNDAKSGTVDISLDTWKVYAE